MSMEHGEPIEECHYFGHQHQREILIEHVCQKRTSIIQITGPPGIGKTTLAKLVINSVPGTPATYFINGQEQQSVQAIENDIKSALKSMIKPEITSNVSIKALLRKLNNNHIFVFDNAEEFSKDYSSVDTQTDFLEMCESLAESPYTTVIIISTFRFHFYKHRFLKMDLQELSDEESKSVILKSVDEISRDNLEDLVHACAGVPAIFGHQMRVRINAGTAIYDLPNIILTEDEKTVHHLMSIIERLSKSIKSYLVTLAYFPGRFGTKAAKHVLGESSTARVKQNALLPIYHRSLIEVDGQRDRFYFHSFIQKCVDANFAHLRDNVTTRERFCEFFSDVICRLAPERKPEKVFPLFTLEIQNIDKLLREIVNCSDITRYEKYIQLACDADYLLINVLPKHSAVNFYEACVNSSKIQGSAYEQGMMLMHYGTALEKIKGHLLPAYSQYMEAEDLLLKDIQDKCGGDDDDQPQGSEALARLYTCIGWNLHMQSKEREAIEILELASKLQDQLQVKRSRHGGLTMNRLGAVHTFVGDLKNAEPCIQESLQIRKQIFGEHPVTAETYNTFGLFYQRSPACEDQTAKYFKMSLRTRQHFNKEPSRDKIISLNNVAMEYAKRGEHSQALKLLDEAYTIQHRLGLNHHDTSLIHNNRGKVYAMMGNYKESESSFSVALDMRKRILGDRHTSTAGTLHQLGETLLKAHKYSQAIDYFLEALHIRKIVLQQQPHNKGIAETLQCLHQAYEESGYQEKATEIKVLLDKELARLDEIKGK